MERVIISYRRDFPPGIRGATDGRGTVWIRRGMSQAERRCAITHELVHIHLGHTSAVDARTEAMVREMTARILIPICSLAAAAQWTLDAAELARELHVTRRILSDRIATLSAIERAVIDARIITAWHQD